MYMILTPAALRCRMVENSFRTSSSVREDVGSSITRIFTSKDMAFTISTFYAGIGGALYAHLVRFISPESFSADQSSMFLVMILVGGMGTFCGPIIGSAIIIFVTEVLQQFGEYQMLIYGALIIFVLFFMPNGIAGTIRNRYYHLLNKVPERRGPKNGKDTAQEG